MGRNSYSQLILISRNIYSTDRSDKVSRWTDKALGGDVVRSEAIKDNSICFKYNRYGFKIPTGCQIENCINGSSLEIPCLL